ncbi:hypothetical protein P7C73_g1276, partial [Tremellales sp. Uapishka_1]
MSYTSQSSSTRVQIRPGTPVDDKGQVKCTGHSKTAKRFQSGPHTKNAGRWFYTCPLPKEDSQKCKFFKWEDELVPTTPVSAKTARPEQPTRVQTIGQSPLKRFTSAESAKDEDEFDEAEEIDWGKVNTRELEEKAIASSPSSTQRSQPQTHSETLGRGGNSIQFNESMRKAVEEGISKRKREDEAAVTPNKKDTNPFVASPSRVTSPRSPSHAYLSPALSSLAEVSEHLYRQERLLYAGEKTRESLRKRIQGLTDRNEFLERRVKELEGRLREGGS